MRTFYRDGALVAPRCCAALLGALLLGACTADDPALPLDVCDALPPDVPCP